MTPDVRGRAFTVLGAQGFLGGVVCRWLASRGAEVEAVPRHGLPPLGRPLGVVLDCAGITGDFRTRPFDTVEAHVTRLVPLLRDGQFERYVYVGTTRVYRRSTRTDEDAPIPVVSSDSDDLYDLSKLLGECFALRTRPEAVVARVSNLYGQDPGAGTFLPQLIREARAVGCAGTYGVRQHPDTARDYVSVEDAARWLAAIGLGATHRVYNIASGRNIPNHAITDALATLTGARAVAPADAPCPTLAPIDARRLHAAFDGPEYELLADLPALVATLPGAPT